MKKADPSLDEVLGSLRAIFEAEKEIAEESRIIEAGQGELKTQLGRLEALLTDILRGQAELRGRLDALEGGHRDLGRLEDLVLRLVARLPLAGLAGEPKHLDPVG
jgi:hypothetical protein